MFDNTVSIEIVSILLGYALNSIDLNNESHIDKLEFLTQLCLILFSTLENKIFHVRMIFFVSNSIQITRVDGNHILEPHGQSGAFVNSCASSVTYPSEGDNLTTDVGCQKGAEVVPIPGTPHLTTARWSANTMQGKDGGYVNLFQPEKIFQVQDGVQGTVVDRSYHVQDFNNTDVSQAHLACVLWFEQQNTFK